MSARTDDKCSNDHDYSLFSDQDKGMHQETDIKSKRNLQPNRIQEELPRRPRREAAERADLRMKYL